MPRPCAIQFVHPLEELAPERYWVPRDLLCYLNDKGNLAELVSLPCVPARKQLSRVYKGKSFPVVVKVASDEPSGSGNSVRICRNPVELRKARAELGGLGRTLFEEEFLEVARNHCIQFAMLADGSCRYLGTAEQVVTRAGTYMGNWIDGECTPSPAAMLACRITAERAAALGYRGVAGFDVVETTDRRVFVIDLNFRVNGSTTALLLLKAIRRRYGRQVLRTRGWPFQGTFGQMCAHVERWNGEGRFLPFSLCNPGESETPPRVAGIMMGPTRQAVTRLEREWKALGFGG